MHYTGISNLLLKYLNKKTGCDYIRVINYHHVSDSDLFRKQIKWYKKNFANTDYKQFEDFFCNDGHDLSVPGIVLTFDDGFVDNYTKGVRVLNEEKMTGWFMVSSDLVGKEDYMSWEQLKEMLQYGHVIGDHTATHHRMESKDTDSTLEYEIVQSKRMLEQNLSSEVSIFCWCGGEEQHYTKKAQSYIEKAGFKYSFMTNSDPVLRYTDKLHIQRTNIEDNWPLPLVVFQLCGFMDLKYKRKRERVNGITKNVN